MSNTALIQVRVDEDIKHKADALFAYLGFDTPTAIRIFLNHSIRREGMPFEIAKPQPKIAMLSGLEMVPKTYNNFREILDEARDEIAREDAGNV